MLSTDLVILLAGLGLAAVAVYLFMQSVFSNNTDANALAWASGDEPAPSKSGFINMSRPLVHNFTLQHAARIKNQRYRNSVEQKILTAGLQGELHVDEFIGLQILWGVMFPLALIVMNFALQLGYSVGICLLIGVLGAYFPHLHCSSSKKTRYTSVINDLPFFIDLMALSAEAGLDFVTAMQRLVEKAVNSVLADELSIVLKDIRLGASRADALRGLAKRLDMNEITSFVAVIIDATDTGTSIKDVLKDQSLQMRLERLVRAEKAGEKASQVMLLPMMFLILPAVFIVVFAPVVLQFFYGGTGGTP